MEVGCSTYLDKDLQSNTLIDTQTFNLIIICFLIFRNGNLEAVKALIQHSKINVDFQVFARILDCNEYTSPQGFIYTLSYLLDTIIFVGLNYSYYWLTPTGSKLFQQKF